MRAIIGMIPFIVLVMVVGCGESEVTEPPFVHRNTVFYAARGTYERSSEVGKSYTSDENGHIVKYSGNVSLFEPTIEIYYEFVGTAFGPRSHFWGKLDNADIYVVVMGGRDTESEIIPVIYQGEKTVLVDEPDLQVGLRPGGEEPTE